MARVLQPTRFWAYNVLYIMVSRAAPPLGEGVSTLQDFTPPLYVLLQNRYACHRLPVSYLHLVAGGLQRSRIPLSWKERIWVHARFATPHVQP